MSRSIETYDAFISYSGADAQFASNLERALEHYSPPKSIGKGTRRLRVFRYEGDMVGTEYYEAIEQYLGSSNALIVLCSPEARESKFVADEIERYNDQRPNSATIIPVLVRGSPNHEAQKEDDKAFPDGLYRRSRMPLAIDYRKLNPKRDKPNRDPYGSQWFTLLANIYSISRDEIEQRDIVRRRRRLAIAASLATTVAVALGILSVVALFQRNEAVSAQLSAQATVSVLQADNADHVLAILLAKNSLDLTRRSNPSQHMPRAESLIHLITSQLPGIGLAGWQAPIPRQTSTQPWAASDSTGRWLITGNFGRRTDSAQGAVSDARLWDLSRELPNQAPAILTGVRLEQLRKGVFRQNVKAESTGINLPERGWTLSADGFYGEEEPCPRSEYLIAFTTDGRWVLTKRGDAGVFIERFATRTDGDPEHRQCDGPTDNTWPPLRVELEDDPDQIAGNIALHATPDHKWLVLLGLRGHRLINVPAREQRPFFASRVSATFWLSDTVFFTGHEDGSIHRWATDSFESRNFHMPDQVSGLIRNLALSPNGEWLYIQDGPGAAAILRLRAEQYELIYSGHDAMSNDGPDPLATDLEDVYTTSHPWLLRGQYGDDGPEPELTQNLALSNDGVLTIETASGTVQWDLMRLSTIPNPDSRTVFASPMQHNQPSSEYDVVRKESLYRRTNGDGESALVGLFPDIGGGLFVDNHVFSRDGRWLLLRYSYLGYESCGYGTSARLISLSDAQPMRNAVPLDPGREPTTITASGVPDCLYLGFSSGGTWAVNSNTIWQLSADRLEPITLPGHILGIHPDDNIVAVESGIKGQRTVSLISVLPDDLGRRACAKAGRNVSWEEWKATFPAKPYRAICESYPLPTDHPTASEYARP